MRSYHRVAQSSGAEQLSSMLREGAIPPQLAEGLPTHDLVLERLKAFQAVKNPILCWLLLLLPWGIFLALLVLGMVSIRQTVIPTGPGTVMFTSGLIAAALSLVAFQVLMHRIPRVLATLSNRSLIKAKTVTGSAPQSDGSNGNTDTQPAFLPPPRQYLAFVSSFEYWLNHPGQWFLGLIFVFLVIVWTVLVKEFPPIGSADFYGILIEYPIGFVVGFMSWRMIVTGVAIWRLGEEFDLTPQLGHPDHCGGLEPIGSLCLWNALIVSIAGIHLGGWITLGLLLGPSDPYGSLAIFWTPTYSALLLVPLAYAFVSFLVPVWRVHQLMVAKRTEVWQQLDQLGQKIDNLQRELLDRVDELGPDEYEKLSKNLDQMRRTYQQNTKFPVWPFNFGTYIKFAVSQLLPLLGLILGMVEPILF